MNKLSFVSIKELVALYMVSHERNNATIKEINDFGFFLEKALSKKNKVSIVEYGKEYIKELKIDEENLFDIKENNISLKNNLTEKDLIENILSYINTEKLLKLFDLSKKFKNKQMKRNKSFLKSILCSKDVVSSIRNNLEKLLTIIPELKPTIGFDQKHPHHHLDVFEHTLLALSLSENNFDLRLILLLHDIGKPIVAMEDHKGIRHFRGHGIISKELSKEILTRLGYENEYINKICKIIKEHDDKLTEETIKNNIGEAKLKLKVQICDGLAHNPTTHKFRYAYFEFVKKTIEKFENAKEF